jgi:hypothetical protein
MSAAVLPLLAQICTVAGVRGAMLATAEGTVGAAEHAHLQPGVAIDVGKTVRRLVVASTTANSPLRELLINFGPSRMMLRPMGEDVLVILLDRDAETQPIRSMLDTEIARRLRALRGEPETIAPVGVHETDDEVAELLASPLGPVLREIEAVYHTHRRNRGLKHADTRKVMHEQIKEWLLCCNPSNYTLPLLLDGLSETMTDDPKSRTGFVSEVQGILRRAGALR